jgi:predicted O-methyltransferase YrrM
MKLNYLIKVIEYINKNTKNNKDIKLSEVYGTENFCYFLYSLIKMEQPKIVVELGSGFGTCSFMMAQALKENNKGKIWTIDNGSDWHDLKEDVITKFHSHKDYFNDLIEKFNLKNFIELIDHIDTSENLVFYPNQKIDLLFADAQEVGPVGCMNLLKGYLPIMNSSSSIFIDRASTINHSFLLLEKVINELQNNKINSSLIDGLPKKEQETICEMVLKTKFTLIHLVEKNNNKVNKLQNSTAWIKIEPIDYIFRNDVDNIMPL